MFGKRVEFTFKGKKTYQTSIGALISLFIKLILVLYIGYEFYLIFNRSHPLTSTKYIQNDLYSNPGSFNPKEFGFDIAFALITRN